MGEPINLPVPVANQSKTSGKSDQDDFQLRERNFGSFQRSFRVPANVDADKIGAKFDEGVKVKLPKTAAAIQEERKIDDKGA